MLPTNNNNSSSNHTIFKHRRFSSISSPSTILLQQQEQQQQQQAMAATTSSSTNSVAITGVTGTATITNSSTGVPGITTTQQGKASAIVLQGYLRKLKKNKKKYFVVFNEQEIVNPNGSASSASNNNSGVNKLTGVAGGGSSGGSVEKVPTIPARLEYYDSEKKFKSSLLKNSTSIHPKRSIILKNCFNINKRLDTKYKHVIALYTKADCFCIVYENEGELDKWLRELLKLQRGEEDEGCEPPRPIFGKCLVLCFIN